MRANTTTVSVQVAFVQVVQVFTLFHKSNRLCVDESVVEKISDKKYL